MGIKNYRCKDCEHAKELNATMNWKFIGCTHEPYKGKWVAEIKDCPKEAKAGNAQKIVAEIEKIDVGPLKATADEATKMKEYLREWERMNDIIREKLSPKETRSAELTSKIQKARELPKELLKTAALPIDGLAVDEKGRIRIDGTLLDGLSEGESIDFAFKLAKVQAGELRVICVDGWQNLGGEMQERIIESAKEDDLQYFITETVPGEDFKIEIL